jgi:hypothetical protein
MISYQWLMIHHAVTSQQYKQGKEPHNGSNHHLPAILYDQRTVYISNTSHIQSAEYHVLSVILITVHETRTRPIIIITCT